MEGGENSLVSFVVQDDNARRFPGSAGRRQRCCSFSLRWRNPVLVAAKVALLVVTVLVSANSNFEQRCGASLSGHILECIHCHWIHVDTEAVLQQQLPFAVYTDLLQKVGYADKFI